MFFALPSPFYSDHSLGIVRPTKKYNLTILIIICMYVIICKQRDTLANINILFYYFSYQVFISDRSRAHHVRPCK